MEIEISYETKSSYFDIKPIGIDRVDDIKNSKLDTLTYLMCPVNRLKTEKSSKKFILNKKISPALRDFLELGESYDTEYEQTEIKHYCEKYGLLLDIKSYTNLLSDSMGYKKFSDTYKNRLCPNELENTVSMPLCIFKFYKKLFDNICELHEYIGCLKQHPSQRIELAEKLISTYFNLLLQPYFFELPEPYNHHFKKKEPLARFSIHYARYINDHCLDREYLNPDTFWKIAQKAFIVNNEYKKIASHKGHGTVLRQQLSSTEYIEFPRLEIGIPYCKNDPLKELYITYLFAQDLISDEYEDIFSTIIPTLRKHGHLKIDPDYSITVYINKNEMPNFDNIIDLIIKNGILLIEQILSSYTYGLSLQYDKDNDIMKLNVENLLQYLTINLLDTFRRSRITKCIHKNCNHYVLSFVNDESFASKCCSKHYEAERKRKQREQRKYRLS